MILTSPKNEWIRQLRQLQQTKGRREQGAFLVEGTHLLQEAIGTQWPLVALCYTPNWAERSSSLIKQIPDQVRQQLVSPEVLKALATTETPEGVVAVAEQIPLKERELPIQLGIALETLQDPGNLGALIRTAVAAGADALWVTEDSVDPENSKVLRASAGQWFRLPPRPIRDLRELIRTCQWQQVQVLAATMPSSSEALIPYWQMDLTKPTVFVLGNEGSGLSPEIRQLVDGLIQIPMAPGVESLNVGITGALLLYEALRQRQGKSP